MKIKKNRKINEDILFDSIMNIMVILSTIVVLYPLYFVVIASISDPGAVNSGQVLLLPKSVGLEGYKYILNDHRIWSGYRNTILYTSGGTLMGLILTILGGYALSRHELPGSGLFTKLIVFTMYFSGGLIPTYLVVKNLQLVNKPYVLMILGSFSAYNLIITRTFFASKIPQEFWEAANMDGCGNGRFFTSIVLPLSKEILAVIGLFYAVGHWNSFFNALIYVNDQKYYPLQLVLREILITSQSLQNNQLDMDNLAAMHKVAETIKYSAIIVSALPVLLVYPFIQRFFVKGIMIGGIKG